MPLQSLRSASISSKNCTGLEGSLRHQSFSFNSFHFGPWLHEQCCVLLAQAQPGRDLLEPGQELAQGGDKMWRHLGSALQKGFSSAAKALPQRLSSKRTSDFVRNVFKMFGGQRCCSVQ